MTRAADRTDGAETTRSRPPHAVAVVATASRLRTVDLANYGRAPYVIVYIEFNVRCKALTAWPIPSRRPLGPRASVKSRGSIRNRVIAIAALHEK
jgi:hypothetical protein